MKKIIYLVVLAIAVVTVTSCDKKNDPIADDPTPIITHEQLQGTWDFKEMVYNGEIKTIDDFTPSERENVIERITFYINEWSDRQFGYKKFSNSDYISNDYRIDPAQNLIMGNSTMTQNYIYFKMISISSDETEIVLLTDFLCLETPFRPKLGTYTFVKQE